MIERQDRVEFVEQLRERRRRGRPRSASRKVRTTVDLPADVFDALCQVATRERKPLHALLVQALSLRASPDFHP